MCATRSCTTSMSWKRSRSKGARFVEELNEVPEGAVTVFSAHGVPQSVVAEAAQTRAAGAGRHLPAGFQGPQSGQALCRQGRTLILIGHAGHPEVEGTMGQVGAPVMLVQSEDDVARWTSRSTHRSPMSPRPRFPSTTPRASSQALKKRFTDIVGPETSRHLLRHPEPPDRRCASFAKVADVILVVGAQNSSNSNRLREIGLEEGVPSYLIADGSELNPAWVARQGTWWD